MTALSVSKPVLY